MPHLLANLASASDVLVPAARQLDPTLRAATAVTDQARESLAEVQELLNQSRALPEQIVHLLEEIEDAARSLRLLAEMLERQPEAIGQGRPTPASAGGEGRLRDFQRRLPTRAARICYWEGARRVAADSTGAGDCTTVSGSARRLCRLTVAPNA